MERRPVCRARGRGAPAGQRSGVLCCAKYWWSVCAGRGGPVLSGGPSCVSPGICPYVTGWVRGPIANSALACLSLRARLRSVRLCLPLCSRSCAHLLQGWYSIVTLLSGPVLHAHACCLGALRAGWLVQPLHMAAQAHTPLAAAGMPATWVDRRCCPFAFRASLRAGHGFWHELGSILAEAHGASCNDRVTALQEAGPAHLQVSWQHDRAKNEACGVARTSVRSPGPCTDSAVCRQRRGMAGWRASAPAEHACWLDRCSSGPGAGPATGGGAMPCQGILLRRG